MNRLNITSILASIITERDENMQQLVLQLCRTRHYRSPLW